MFFFFNDTATTEIYTLSLHDALPIWQAPHHELSHRTPATSACPACAAPAGTQTSRSEEHTSELQSRSDVVCRLLLEKKKTVRPGTLRRKASARAIAVCAVPHATCTDT